MGSGDTVEPVEPGGQGSVEQVVAVEVETVEEVGVQQQVAFAAGPEPAHRLLERAGPARVGEGEGLAVEDDAAARQVPHELDEFRDGGGDVAQGAGEHPHVLVAAVDLDAGAVEFVLDAHRAVEFGERGVERVGGGGEHRPHGPAQFETEGGQRVHATGERRGGGLREPAGEHHRPPHRFHR